MNMTHNTKSGDERKLFTGAASYYATYRPWYPEEMFAFLRQYCTLDGKGSLLDLGCGTGQILLPFAKDFEEVVGLDIEPEMLAEAKKEADKRGVKNARWIHGKAENISEKTGTFKLVTAGASLHWMEGAKVLEKAYAITEEGGGVALIQNPTSGWTNNKEEWKKARKKLVQKYLGEKRRNGSFIEKWKDWEDLLEESPFGGYDEWTHDYELTWTLDETIGYLYSTSFASRDMFGDRVEAFEKELTAKLLAVEPSGIFREQVQVQVLTSKK